MDEALVNSIKKELRDLLLKAALIHEEILQNDTKEKAKISKVWMAELSDHVAIWQKRVVNVEKTISVKSGAVRFGDEGSKESRKHLVKSETNIRGVRRNFDTRKKAVNVADSHSNGSRKCLDKRSPPSVSVETERDKREKVDSLSMGSKEIHKKSHFLEKVPQI